MWLLHIGQECELGHHLRRLSDSPEEEDLWTESQDLIELAKSLGQERQELRNGQQGSRSIRHAHDEHDEYPKEESDFQKQSESNE